MDASRTPVPKRKRDVIDVEEATAPIVVTAQSHNKAPPQKKAKNTTTIDDDLADAVSNSDDTEDDRSMSQPALPSLASSDVTWLIRADDPVKNRVLAAITDSRIWAAYLQEVGNRTLYITNDPFPTNPKAIDFEVAPEVRAALKDRLINGLTWKGCVPAYNGNGGNVADFPGVEKAVKLHAKDWFAEQNVAVPWKVIDSKRRSVSVLWD